ncbi:adenosylcobinamide amidohydrolase [Lentibacillus cibarius]|uniref:ATP-binding cassette domain-containing protein n=1 Tax=Lentibacillus cibarius TaxID=2583219 RepID=A0A5S3QQ27_9BACI|nr:adenosylcobinamide amidohydrolase [Lentibacillus cibarius]TMN22656.1 ATP-binding cassette domain-containing protein [Lentibacillus cibarius]
MMQLENLAGGYMNPPTIQGVNIKIEKGEFFVLLGPNGSGKTTLFKLITGQLPIQGGNVFLEGKNINSFSKLERAKKLAVLTQEIQVSFDYTVEEIVSLGRYPHQKGIIKILSQNDQTIIDEVMELTKISHFRNKPFRTISGGEKQRVLLAKALVQQPEVLLLDEPTNHLDIKHTFQILDLLKRQQQTNGLTVFSILHDLNVASLYADRVALLHEGTFLEVGDVDTLRKTDQLKKVYEVDIQQQSHPTIPKPQLLMTPGYSNKNNRTNFEQSYQIKQTDDVIHVAFDQSLRTISNGVIGDGIQWSSHFCNFHVSKKYNCANPETDIKQWMIERNIPHECAVGMMTAVKLKDAVIVTKKIDGLSMLVLVTAGADNAVDITNSTHELEPTIGTINTMVFVDAHFTDGALVNASKSATETKVKALQDLDIKDPLSNTVATGTSTDALLIGVTQQGKKTPYAGSGTVVGKRIGSVVYQATRQALEKELHRVEAGR